MLQLLALIQDHVEEAAGHAADDHGAHAAGPMAFEWVTFVSSIVVFLIAFFILWRLVWPKITRALDERDQKIRDEIRSAEEAREQAKAALSQYERELAGAREEASRMIQQAKSQAKAAAEELRKRNEQELGELRQRATREIETAKQAALSEIHAEAATLATRVASRILQREISVDDQRRLVDESLEQLSTAR
jgi:F-type H+-transporting ATPase subunit b